MDEAHNEDLIVQSLCCAAVPSVGRSDCWVAGRLAGRAGRLVLDCRLEAGVGVVVLMLQLLPDPTPPRSPRPRGGGTGFTVGSDPELSSLVSSILVSLEAVFRKLLTASLFFKGGIFARSLSWKNIFAVATTTAFN